jgi:hypothetical protein
MDNGVRATNRLPKRVGVEHIAVVWDERLPELGPEVSDDEAAWPRDDDLH